MKLNILSRITFLSVNTLQPTPSAFTEQITVDRKCYGEPIGACCITMFAVRRIVWPLPLKLRFPVTSPLKSGEKVADRPVEGEGAFANS